MSGNTRLRRIEESWRVRLVLDAAAIHTPAIQFAIFTDDPKARFAAELRMRGDSLRSLAERPEGDTDALAGTLSAIWNGLFRAVTGDRVALLFPAPHEHGYMSNEAPGPKWLATTTARGPWGARSWCVPFEAVPGRVVTIELDATNALDLAALGQAAADAS
jgi:hypothetical protein